MAERVIQPLATAPGAKAGVVAPFQFVVTGEDNLRWRTWCGFPLAGSPGQSELTVRMIDANGVTQITTFVQSPTSVSAPAEMIIALGVGAVVNLSVRYKVNAIAAPAIFNAVDLVRGTVPASLAVIGQLLGGYVTNAKALTWPGSEIEPWTRGSGLQRRLDLTPAGPGLEPSHAIAACRAFRPIAVTGTFVASAVAGTRFPTMRLGTDGFTTINATVLPLLIALAAGGSGEVTWADGYGGQLTGVPPRYYGPMPRGLILPPGSVVEGKTAGFQAGDQWFDVYLWGEEYVLPQA